MKRHLDIILDGHHTVLPEDFSIDIEDKNPYFNDTEMYTYPVEIPFEGNREIVRNMDDPHSDDRPMRLEKMPIRIIAEGMPFRSGKVQIDDDQDLDGAIGLSSVSSVRTLSDLIGNLNCQDIPVKDKIQIGEMIGNVVVDCAYNYKMESKNSGKTGFLSWRSHKSSTSSKADEVVQKFQLRALGFSFPGICSTTGSQEYAVKDGTYSDGKAIKPKVKQSFINVTDCYPTKPYCNVRVCYMHYKAEEVEGSDDKKSSDVVETTLTGANNTYNPYFVLEADRPQSGICFYVLYFLDCLFSYLNLKFDNSALTAVGDMNRLFFFTTQCKYDLERKYPSHTSPELKDIDQINKWLTSRGTRAQLEWNYESTKDIDSITYNGKEYRVGDKLPDGTTLKYAHFKVEDPEVSITAELMNMYANSMNFPSDSVSTVIDSLWNQFGVKLMMDYEKQSVKAVFVRDIFRNTAEPIDLPCTVISVVKVVEKTSGVRMKYSQESDKKEKAQMVRDGKTDYDTDYDYTDYSNVDATKDYQSIIRQQGCTDKTCYIDKNTGNAYRLKVNSEAQNASELKPSLFEVGGMTGVELGDCSIENEENIEEMVSDFVPLQWNDVNSRYEQSAGDDTTATMINEQDGSTATISNVDASRKEQILAVFVDEEMWHENIKAKIRNALGSNYANFYLDEVMQTTECYDPTSTDDGNSPLQHVDWGLAIGLQRGGGSDAKVQLYDYDYDGFGSYKWRMTAGQYMSATDSIDCWGNDFDYNGTLEGVGTEERFSLKPRAYKVIGGEIMCKADEVDADGRITRKVRSRGYVDTFLGEYSQFLLNRKLLRIEVLCEVATLKNIPDHWERRYRIGTHVGWINKVSSRISVGGGLEKVEIELYTL